MFFKIATISLILSIQIVWAQISITSGDVLGLIGQTHLLEEDDTGSITVNVGSAGANQSWDFSSIQIQGETGEFQYLSPAGTPFVNDFPQSNMVMLFDLSSGDTTAQFYNYLQVLPTYLTSLGSGVKLTFPDTMYTEIDNDTTPFPLTFGSQWSSTSIDTIPFFPGSFLIDIYITESQVDAWGSVTVPAGTFQCLRLRDDDTHIVQTVIENQVVSSDTGVTINYQWISKEAVFLASAESQEGETNPNFTNAQYFTRTKSLSTTGLQDLSATTLIEGFQLEQNFPNPFNPQTSIQYTLNKNDFLQITIHDESGHLITTLVNGNKSAGAHNVLWNGKNDKGVPVASGIYFYTLRAGGKNIDTKRMILLK